MSCSGYDAVTAQPEKAAEGFRSAIPLIVKAISRDLAKQ